MVKRVLIFMAILSSLSANSQTTLHPYIKNFKAQSADGKIFVSWTTKAGFSCQDINIEISTDSVQFMNAGTYFGLCGDFEEKDYTYIIEEPYLNRLNYIRLDLGTYGYSYVISERVIKVNSGYLIVPNPAQATSVLYFDNPFREDVTLTIYSSLGILAGSISTNQASIGLNQFSLQPGLYVFLISSPNADAIRGKFFFEEL